MFVNRSLGGFGVRSVTRLGLEWVAGASSFSEFTGGSVDGHWVVWGSGVVAFGCGTRSSVILVFVTGSFGGFRGRSVTRLVRFGFSVSAGTCAFTFDSGFIFTLGRSSFVAVLPLQCSMDAFGGVPVLEVVRACVVGMSGSSGCMYLAEDVPAFFVAVVRGAEGVPHLGGVPAVPAVPLSLRSLLLPVFSWVSFYQFHSLLFYQFHALQFLSVLPVGILSVLRVTIFISFTYT